MYRKITFVALTVLLTCGSRLVPAQEVGVLVGTWERTALKRTDGTMSPQPTSILVFAPDGFYCQIALPTDRPKSDTAADNMSREELLARFRGVDAYWGTWSVKGDVVSRSMKARVNSSRLQNFEQRFRFEGDELVLVFVSGMGTEARFKRVK